MIESLSFTGGSYSIDSFVFASDGYGGISVADPTPWTASSVGGPNPLLQSVSFDEFGNEKFIFQPGSGAATVNNFSTASDKIELDNFTNINCFADLQPLIYATNGGNGTIIHLDSSVPRRG